jgi:CheY-like chemotaxis protein
LVYIIQMYNPNNLAVKYQTCLLIDDSPIDNFINSSIIKSTQLVSEIIIMQLPAEALAMLEAEQIKPDIIFLDITMPVMNGFEFLKEYEKLNINKEDIQIFMLSTSINKEEINKAINNKFVRKFFTKPLTRQMLAEI